MKKWHLVVIYVIGLIIASHYAFTTNYTEACDTAIEYGIYLSYIEHGIGKVFPSLFDNVPILSERCLTVTLVPYLVKALIGSDTLLTFKIYGVILVSLLPVVVCILSTQITNHRIALVASAYLMCQTAFIQSPSYLRTILAITAFIGILIYTHKRNYWAMVGCGIAMLLSLSTCL
jgi:uncharacterized membrane protein